MTMPPRYRDVARAQLRDAIVGAARELTIAYGWDSVRMAQVAAVVGVSRQTVYNEFTNKAGLAEAMASREVTRFVTEVRGHLFAHGEDLRAGAHAAIRYVLEEAAGNPLIKAILTSARGGSDELLPFLTTRAELVLVGATAVLREWAHTYAPGLPEKEFAFGAESIVRVVVSHIVLPTAAPEDTAAGLADLAALFVDGLRAHAARTRSREGARRGSSGGSGAAGRA